MNAYKELLKELDARLQTAICIRDGLAEGITKETKTSRDSFIDGAVHAYNQEIDFLQRTLERYSQVDVEMDIELKYKKHNERNAGRKKSYTDEQIAQAIEWRKIGKSYKEIGQLVGLSTGTVHKLIGNKNK